MTAVSHRHDILFFFDVLNGNPNGDPDAGNMPRFDPVSKRGLVSDVCLKRKVRNFVTQFPPDRKSDEDNDFHIFIQQGNILNQQIKRGIDTTDEKIAKDKRAEAAKDWLCRNFYDIRTFGAVLSTGEEVMKGSAHGQVRGPVQITFGRSVDPILSLEMSITRCAVTKEEDAAKERTMGNKHIIPYALYSARAFVSPIFAERTGFDDADLSLLFESLQHLFSHDQSAARAEMNVRAIYDFEHVGTQPGNAQQNQREAKLGCAHAHKLFAGIRFRKKDGVQEPTSFEDYVLEDDWADKDVGEGCIVPGVKLHRILEPNESEVSA